MTWPTLTPAIHRAHLALAIDEGNLTLATVATMELEEWSRYGAGRSVDLRTRARSEPPGGSTPPTARKSPLG